jgi:hypothetical protein
MHSAAVLRMPLMLRTYGNGVSSVRQMSAVLFPAHLWHRPALSRTFQGQIAAQDNAHLFIRLAEGEHRNNLVDWRTCNTAKKKLTAMHRCCGQYIKIGLLHRFSLHSFHFCFQLRLTKYIRISRNIVIS